MKKTTILFLLFLIGCSQTSSSLHTKDNVQLSMYYLPFDGSTAIVLIPMLGSTKESYNDFVRLLHEQFAVLVYDPRGHGDSDLDWRTFSEEDFNAMVYDVEAAVRFLKEEGYTRIHLVGASIGANTVLNYAAGDDQIKKLVLLSPGMNYRGVDTSRPIKKFQGKLLIIASSEDDYAFASSEKLMELSPAEKKMIKLALAGHGTRMLSAPLMQNIIEWLK